MSSGGLETSLHNKVGGIPVWGLGTGLAALIIVFVAYRNHQKYKNQETTPNTDSSTSDQQGQEDPNAIDPNTGLPYADEAPGSGFPYGPINSYLGGDPTNAAYPVGGFPQGAPPAITNQQWARLASDFLIGKGNDPTLVENALAHYINGTSLSAAEHAIVNLALQAFGSPPEGVLASPPPPPPGNTATPTDVPTDHFYHVQKKETYTSIAKHEGVFGGNGAALFAYNMISNKHQSASFSHYMKNYPNVVKGDQVAIPKKGHKVALGNGVGVVTT